jgi:hypothetical protein
MTHGFASLLRAAVAALATVAVMSTTTAAATAAAADLTFNGYARDPATRRLLYVEMHHVRGAGTATEARVVQYRCATGNDVFARKELDYGAQRELPAFTLLDARSGYTEGLRRTPQGLRVFQKSSAAAPLREAALPAGAAPVADAGFDEFVRRHWAELEAGRTVRFPFLVPSRLEVLTFKLHKHHEETIDGAPASVIRLNLSGVLGWFVPNIDVAYSKGERILRRYKGLTNLHDASGSNLVAVIDFPLAERRSVAAVPLEALRSGALVTRCPAAG